TRLRRRAVWLSNTRDALAFAFVVAGTFLGLRAAYCEARLAEERRRLDQQRIDELDTFAGRVAHDLRDLLGLVLMRAALAERAATLESCRREIGKVVEKSQRMNDVLVALLAFARAGGRPDPGARCEVGAIARQVVAEVQHLAAE